MKTRTGGFPIGFRRSRVEWQKDLPALIEWAKNSGMEVLDLGTNGDEGAKQVVEAGLRLGSVDLPTMGKMITADPGKRKEAIAASAEYIAACAAAGAVNHFTLMLPEDQSLSMSENFGHMVAAYSELIPVMEQHNARLVVEGWPGAGALCCTPESYRAFLKELPSPAMGVNYDPSHLIRMGIDPLRFLREFVGRVYHVHAKDTELNAENLYEYGHEHPPTFGNKVRYGGMCWRYTIPGQGCMYWAPAFSILAEAGYEGCVSIELEDANFCGSEETEKQGLILGAQFLAGC